MFAENLLIGFYWGPRTEGLDVCTERVEDFLRRLASLDSMFSNWFKEFSEDQLAIPMSKERICELLLSGLCYPDVGDQPMKDSGYSVTLYNSSRVDSLVQLRLRCDEIHPKINNLCLLQAIAGTPAHDELSRIPLVLDLCRLMIDYWKPDWGIVSCNAITETLEPESMSINAGWIMYHSLARGDLPALPSTARVETIPDRGHLVIASEDLVIPPTPEAIEDVRVIFEAMESAKT